MDSNQGPGSWVSRAQGPQMGDFEASQGLLGGPGTPDPGTFSPGSGHLGPGSGVDPDPNPGIWDPDPGWFWVPSWLKARILPELIRGVG